MNSVALSGRLTKKPELRTTQSGNCLCNFSLAVNRYGSEDADFIECVCFNKVAENLCKYQDKGNMIELNGRLQNNRYTDKEGKKVSKTLICAEMINYISQPKTNGYEAKNDQKDPYKEFSNRINGKNDLPF